MALPNGFTYLRDVDASIIQIMSYATNINFVGKKVNGYLRPFAIITQQAANALKNVQTSLKAEGFSLVIYDAYRPQKATEHFALWALDSTDLKQQNWYYPEITDKSKIFELGYIIPKSAHSRGSTVDVSIIKLGDQICGPFFSKRALSDGRFVPYINDGTCDMYSSFDLFDEVSWHDTSLIPKHNLVLRNYLRNIMKQHGFLEYKKEWWHFTLDNEPFKNEYFDFNVV
jgi:D-alanyl-D-alanine dipeptidase